jgi:hypothetical protein
MLNELTFLLLDLDESFPIFELGAFSVSLVVFSRGLEEGETGELNGEDEDEAVDLGDSFKLDESFGFDDDVAEQVGDSIIEVADDCERLELLDVLLTLSAEFPAWEDGSGDVGGFASESWAGVAGLSKLADS